MTRRIRLLCELLALCALILVPRFANYKDVFVAGNVYFTDADCYARMTRVRLCAAHPGLIVRHHGFENFPVGTTPHTTAPLDYLILGLSILLRPFVPNAIDLAGALVSPLLALAGGWFLWWWAGRMKFRYRWPMLILYSLSPILVHGTELGRPDHQSLLMLLVTAGLCAMWRLRTEQSRNWSVAAGFAWGLALWVSFYEPLLLLLVILMAPLLKERTSFTAKPAAVGWIVFAAIIILSFLIERRLPSPWSFHGGDILTRWAHTIGELQSVPPLNSIWFRWVGYMIVIAPIFIWMAYRRKILPVFVIVLLIVTYGLTIWQVRWAYFFALLFMIALPAFLEAIRSRLAVWVAFVLAMLPVLLDWDQKIWPDDAELARRIEQRREAVELHDMARSLMSVQVRPFLAPWWLSPSIAYWSGQPGVAGSSHESLGGIADSARFFLAQEPATAQEILRARHVSWVIAYDGDRVVINSAAILDGPASPGSFGRILYSTPGSAPPFLQLVGQNGTAKLFQAKVPGD